MTSHPRRMFGLAAAFVLIAASAQAQGHGKGHDKDKDKDHDRGGEMRRDDQGRWDNTQNRNLPPGLAKKPGGLPPGQYKKRYTTSQGVGTLSDVFNRHGYHVVRTASSGDKGYVWYRLPNGTVNRAIVSPGTDRLGFSNVPTSLLQEVLSRLY